MSSSAVFTAERNWNRLGLRASWRPWKPVFPRSAMDSPGVEVTVIGVAGKPEDWASPAVIEVADDEFVALAEREGHFSFLDDPSENIYTWEDGEDL